MKKLLLFAAALLSASAMAGVKLSVRSDYQNIAEIKDTSGSVSVENISALYPVFGNLMMDGKIGDATVKTQFNLREGDFSKAVDYMYITKPLGAFSFSAGKIEVNTGGFESARILAGDNYLFTTTTDGRVQGSLAQNKNLMGNSSGAGVAYNMGDHRFEFQFTNMTNANGKTGKKHNQFLNYTGSLLDKSLNLNVGYAMGSTFDNTTSPVSVTSNETNMNLGVQYVSSLAEFTFDYLANSTKGLASTAKADTTNSMVLEVRKSIDMWAPVAKIESSEFKKSEDATVNGSFKRTGIALGVEMTPKAGDEFRYHFAYSSTTDKYGTTGAKDVVQSTIMAGFKFTGDLLK